MSDSRDSVRTGVRDGGGRVASMIQEQCAVVDPRAVGAVPSASGDVADLWQRAIQVSVGELPGMGLLAGDRPTADVEVLAGAYAAVEYELARRMHAATMAGSLPLVGPGAVLGARRWAVPHARRLARAGALAADHPSLAAAWAAGIITSRSCGGASPATPTASKLEELAAVIGELASLWGGLVPERGGNVRGPGGPDAAPTPGPGRRRDRRPRVPVAVVRPDRRLGGPGRHPAPAGGRGCDRRGRRVR